MISTSGGSPQFLMFGSTGVPGAYQSLGVSTDASYSGGPSGGATQGLKLTQAWGVRGAFNHNWDPLLVDQPLGQVRYGGDALDILTAKEMREPPSFSDNFVSRR